MRVLSPENLSPRFRPPLLILCAQIAALALTRRLGKAGVTVGLVDTVGMETPPAFHSRYARYRWSLPPEAEAEAWLRAIETAGDALRLSPAPEANPALIATSDETVLLISRHRQRLAPRFRLLLPEAATLELLLDKRRLHPLAAAHGVAVPRSLAVGRAADLQPAADELGFPLLLKSAYGKVGAGSGARLSGKVRVENLQELHHAYAALAGADARLLLQEYLAGGAERVVLYNAYFDTASRPVAVFTGRKLRQYPVEFGTASMSEACAVPGLAEPLTAFLQSLHYRGPVDIGLKWDARGQLYKLLDVNPRLGQNYRTFIGPGGVDLGWLSYCELAGAGWRGPAPLQAEPRRWKIEVQDLRSCLELRRRRQLSTAAWARDWWAWRHGRHERAFWSWRDPRPGLAQWRRQRGWDTHVKQEGI